MARPRKTEDSVQTPAKIGQAALDVFAAQGFSQANLAEIARRVGISRPSLLYHFESKEVLFEHVLLKAFAEVGELLRGAMQASGTFEQRLHRVVVGFDRYMMHNPSIACLLARELIAPDGLGKTLLINETLPLLDEVEAWIQAEGAGQLRAGVLVRDLLMHVVSNAVLKASAGEVSMALWGKSDPWTLVQATLLEES